MALTRIANNQITDATIVASSKLQDNSISAGKLANNLNYGSNFTITGNLTVNGTSTTLDTVNTIIEDPVLLLGKDQTGVPAFDLGFVGERGDENNAAFVWKESADAFQFGLTTGTADGNTITLASFADTQAKDMTMVNLAPSGNVTTALNASSTIEAGTSITAGTTVSATGNVSGGNLTTAGQVAGDNADITNGITAGTTITATGNVSGGNITTAGDVDATGNVAGGNITTGGQVVATGNITGGNLITAGTFQSASITATGNVTGGNLVTAGAITDGAIVIDNGTITGGVAATFSGAVEGGSLTDGTATISSGAITGATSGSFSTTLTATGNVTGGNITTAAAMDSATINTTGEATLASAIVSDLTSGRVVLAGTSGAIEDSANATFDGSTLGITGAITASTTVTATGNVAGGNITTGGRVDATGTIEGGTLTDGTASINSGAITGATSGSFSTTLTATGNVTGGNVNTAGVVAATGNVSGGNITTGGDIDATGDVAGGSVTTNVFQGSLPVISSTGTNADISINPNGSGSIDVNSAKIIQLATPTADGDAANKAYVDSVAEGLDIKASCHVATTGVLPAVTYANGTDGVGATLTADANGAFAAVDGVTLTINERILVKDQAAALQNGIYQLSTVGDAGSAFVLTRATDFDNGSPSGEIPGAFTFIEEGTVNEDNGFVCTTNAPVTVGTTAIVWTQFSGAGSIVAGNGLSKTGETLNVEVDDVTTAIVSDEVTVKVSANLTTPNIGVANGDSLTVTGNIGGVSANFSGVAIVTGNVTGGNITSGATITDGTYTSTDGVFTGVVSITASANVDSGNVNTAIVDATGAISSDTTITATGNVAGGNITTGGAVEATGLISSGSTITATGNVVGGNLTTAAAMDSATINTTGEATLASAIVSDLTDGRVVLAGTSGAIEDSANLTFDGTTLGATGAITASTTITATGNVTGGNLVTAGQLAADNVAATNGITAGTTIAATGNVSGGNVTTAGQVQADNVDATNGITAGTTIVATGNVTGGNLTTGGDVTTVTVTASTTITATGNVAGGNITTGGAVDATGAVTGASLATGNITIGTDDIDSTGEKITVNQASNDVDFIVEGNGDANLLVLDAGADTVNIGTATVTAGAKLKVGTTDSMMIPVGTTVQRPTGVTGMIRFNTTLDQFEFYDSNSWTTAGSDFTVIQSETFSGDNSTTAFTLGSTQTTASCIVSINGVVQEPTTAYAVSGTTLTFTEAPLAGDTIEVREITTTSTILGLASDDTTSSVTTEDGGDVAIKGNIIPTANATYDLGSSTERWNDLYLTGNTITLGNVVIKNTGGNAVGFFGPDGTTPGVIDANVEIAGDSIVNGTSSVDFSGTNGDVRLTSGGTQSLTVISTGANVVGDFATTGDVRFLDSDNSNYVGFQAPATVSSDLVWTLPSADAGVSGYALVSDGAGTLSFAAAGATVSADTTTNTNFLLYFASTTTGALTAVKQDSGLIYNPSTGSLSSAVFIGDLTGTADAATLAADATKLATARAIEVSGAVTGTADFDGSAAINIVTTATSDPTITLAGDLSGSVTLTNLASGTLTATLTKDPVITLTGAVTGSGTMTNLGSVSIATTNTADPTITLAGDLSGSVTLTNLASGTLTATIAANSVALGTDTTGNYVAAGAVSGVGLSGSASAEGATFTVTSNATSANTASAIVARDGSGNFTAGVITATATAARYADLAEIYASDSEIEAGTVVHFAGEGKVAECDIANCRSVAGIVSTDPAYLMNSDADGVALAIAGRVPTKVTGIVNAGDLIVSAGNGRGMANNDAAIGTVIGKAIEANESGDGVIEVLALMM